jgi:hypothetical protein
LRATVSFGNVLNIREVLNDIAGGALTVSVARLLGNLVPIISVKIRGENQISKFRRKHGNY